MSSRLINSERMLKDLFDLGRIGWEDGRGLMRTSYNPLYLDARSWLSERMEDAGLAVRTDGVGNLFGRVKGGSEDTILLGSHLDSVIGGGIYDGALGIIVALEILRSVKESGMRLNHSLEAVAFAGEEGGQLGGTFGSRVFAGKIPPGYRRELLEPLGITDEDIGRSKGDLGRYKAFLELHIEQGPYLERRDLAIGIPSCITGITRLDVTVNGRADHAGSTPMHERKDAMRGAAELICKWFDWADRQERLVCNIGTISVTPGQVNVVPETVRFVIEMRSDSDIQMNLWRKKITELAKLSTPCTVTVSLCDFKPAVTLDKDLVAIARECSEKAGLQHAVMQSWASHDSSPISSVMPTAMIFVPSHGGISHSKDEFTSVEDILRGAGLLGNIVLALDARA